MDNLKAELVFPELCYWYFDVFSRNMWMCII
jgi:hypothetical protein